MASKKRWTIEEEQVLIDQITRSANNIAEAFRRTNPNREHPKGLSRVSELRP